MNIYEDDGTEGVIDIRRARDELAGVSLIHDAAIRRQNIAEISAAALLDIAASLRAVAADARLGLDDYAAAVVTAAEPEAALAAEVSGVDLVVGDRVETPDGAIGTVLGFGTTEDSTYAEVAFDNGPTAKTWLENLARLVSEAARDPLGIIAETDEALEPTVEDDIDSDFDGDAHPAAASALDLLKANEAERKAKKKGSKK